MKTSTMPIVPGRSGRWRARTSCHCHSGMTSDRTVSTTHRTACPHGSMPDDASHHVAAATSVCATTVPASSV